MMVRDRVRALWRRRPMTLRRYRRLVAERARRQLAQLVRLSARARLRRTWDSSCCVAGATTVAGTAERAPPRPYELVSAASRGLLALPPPRSAGAGRSTARREVQTASA